MLSVVQDTPSKVHPTQPLWHKTVGQQLPHKISPNQGGGLMSVIQASTRRRRPDTPGGVGPNSRMHVHVDPTVKQRAQQLAEREGISLSLFIEGLLRREVDQREVRMT